MTYADDRKYLIIKINVKMKNEELINDNISFVAKLGYYYDRNNELLFTNDASFNIRINKFQNLISIIKKIIELEKESANLEGEECGMNRVLCSKEYYEKYFKRQMMKKKQEVGHILEEQTKKRTPVEEFIKILPKCGEGTRLKRVLSRAYEGEFIEDIDVEELPQLRGLGKKTITLFKVIRGF